MVRIHRSVNIILLIVAAFILMTWVFSGTTTGYVGYKLNSEQAKCRFMSADDMSNEIKDIDLCCYEIQKMITCEEIDSSEEYDYICYNLKEGNKYYLNSKAFNYCIKEEYDVAAN
ncbi:hypothetical protein GF374_00375 [Candidatus Woesearchaeota archaeon]|nr:hypothetical protein [Candidatus Woesearchaeota archaeon]